LYTKETKINSLPSYMCVQFVRFFWKQASVTQDTEGTKAKILRSVAFDRRLDVYEFCSDSLKKSLDQGRIFEEKMIEEQDKQREKKQSEDVEMHEESKEPKLTGAAAKAQMKAE